MEMCQLNLRIAETAVQGVVQCYRLPIITCHSPSAGAWWCRLHYIKQIYGTGFSLYILRLSGG